MSRSTPKRFLTGLSIGSAGLWPMLSFALGIGDLELDSRLNQPLRARIEILDVSDEEWRQIHARLSREIPLDNEVTYSQILDSVTLHPIEDSNHRHFIELKSSIALTEPLFDLPVEVGGPTTRVVRNYSVLLDPPSRDDAPPRRLEAAQPPVSAQRSVSPRKSSGTQKPAPVQDAARAAKHGNADAPSKAVSDHATTVYVVKRSDTLARIVRRLGKHTAADRKQLMQWIFQHNREAFYGDLHHLRANARLTLPESTPPTQQTATHSSRKPAAQENLEGQLQTLQQMLAQMQETISAQDAQIASLTAKIAAAAAARSPVAPSPATPSLAPSSPVAQSRSASAQMPPGGKTEDDRAVPTTSPGTHYWIAALGLITVLATGSSVLIWRRQKDPAGREPLTKATEPSQSASRPSSSQPRRDPKQAGPSDANESGRRPVPSGADDGAANSPTTEEARALAVSDGRSLLNKEVATILEKSLGSEPHRVDVRIKLLEIYHHEVLGNRADFNSLLRELVADPRTLTASQRSHIEKLQRTLSNDEPEAGSDFVTKVAI